LLGKSYPQCGGASGNSNRCNHKRCRQQTFAPTHFFGLEGLKERPWPQQPLLLALRSFLITALDFKGSLAQVAVPVAVEAGVVEA
jgi:hypothetical protein